jgi:SAM-dependent methyltransferase
VVIRCPSCSSANARLIGAIPPSGSFAGIVLKAPLAGGDLFECKECRLGFRWPRLSREELNGYYLQTCIDTWASDKQIRKDWQIIAQWLEKEIGQGSVLDVGCFDGAFLGYLGENWSRFGIEFHDHAAQQAKAKGINIIARDFYAEFNHINERFDAVVTTDVIEHVEDPLQFLGKLKSITRPGGLIAFATGNSHAGSWKFMGSRYWYCALSEHISFINPDWCRWVAGKLKLELIEIIAFSHMGDSSLVFKAQEVFKNILYKTSPRIAGKLRELGFGEVDVSASKELRDYPPSFASAKDHIVALFRI